jgi:hypothetical protein
MDCSSAQLMKFEIPLDPKTADLLQRLAFHLDVPTDEIAQAAFKLGLLHYYENY